MSQSRGGRGAGHPGALRRPRGGAEHEARRYRDEALSDLEGLPIDPERRGELRFLLESVITA